jgi:hypothetical protein
MRPFKRKFIDAFGPARKKDESLTQHHMDLARAVQTVAEEVVLHVAQAARKSCPATRSSGGGGCPARAGGGGRILKLPLLKELPGRVSIATGAETLALRVPGWCRDARATVNGVAVPAEPDRRGYLRITRAWQAGDVVAYAMSMPLRLTVTHPAVDAVHGMVAVERGPVVYCFESPDQPSDVDLNRVEVMLDRPLREEHRDDFLGRPAVVARVPGIARDDSAWSGLGWATLGEEPARRGREVELVAIPYHLWANRGASVMRIFTPAWPGVTHG